MKSKIASFFKPRFGTVFLTFLLVAWQYIYAFRGIDFDALSAIRDYFGFGLSAINWNNFFIRAVSLTAMWLIVAFFIFLILWGLEAYTISSHNRRISQQYLNQPKENYAHLLKTHDISFRKHFASNLWLSGFIILIPFGMFLAAGVIEAVRSDLVISFISSAQDSGMMIDYYSTAVLVTSFLGTLPIWYLYSCLDVFCLVSSHKEQSEAKIEDEHYAVEVELPTSQEDGLEEEDSEQTNTPNPVI